MAKIKTIRYSRTKNLGNYESAKADIEVELEEGDTLNGIRNLAQVLVAQELREVDNDFVEDKVAELVNAGAVSSRGLTGVLL